jgi:hypothetical protein
MKDEQGPFAVVHVAKPNLNFGLSRGSDRLT